MSDIEYRKHGTINRVPQGSLQPTVTGELCVRDSGGEKQAVVLIHGWGADSLITWAGAIPTLRERWRIVAIDLPGHGRSPGTGQFGIARCADGIAEVLKARGIEKSLVCGYSLGGAVMLELAHRHRSCVGAVIPIATGARLVSFGGSGVRTAGGLLRGSRGKGVHDRAEPPKIEHAQHVFQSIIRHDTKSLVGALQDAASFDGREIASKLSIPASMIITKLDVVVRPALQRELAELLAATQVEVNFGHDYCTKKRFAGTLAETIAGLEVVLTGAGDDPDVSAPRV
jgi:pimeloyl-ACP methyl ester carboxylesterase